MFMAKDVSVLSFRANFTTRALADCFIKKHFPEGQVLKIGVKTCYRGSILPSYDKWKLTMTNEVSFLTLTERAGSLKVYMK